MQPCQGGVSPHCIRNELDTVSFSQLEANAGTFSYSLLSLIGIRLWERPVCTDEELKTWDKACMPESNVM